jgi:alkanesulfonate monooxygenase SsuD/methylene tetrahydromethanopterin reductase-like flavin-dependent oxidoreductase (luciferase family)
VIWQPQPEWQWKRFVMKVGLFINTQFPEGFNLAERVPEMVAQVRAAREAGFSSLWFPHHWLTHPMQMLQITPVMGFVAAHAQGMTIGPNILILPPLNPMHVAEEAATLDVLTGGNYILGVGLGYRQPEFDAFGISLSERAPRFNESIALMRRLWTEERVSHKGRFYTVNNAGIGVKPMRPGGPPLYIAGQADPSVRRAARIGDAWLMVNTSGLGKVIPLMQTYRAALKEYGRTPMEYPITVECYVGSHHATAQEECRAPLEYKYNAYASWGLQKPQHARFVRGFCARPVHHRRQRVGEGGDRAVSRAVGCRSLHHALPVAWATAGASAELDPASRRNFRVI